MHQAACFGDMLLSTAKVIFEAHMELTRRPTRARSWSQYATQLKRYHRGSRAQAVWHRR